MNFSPLQVYLPKPRLRFHNSPNSGCTAQKQAGQRAIVRYQRIWPLVHSLPMHYIPPWTSSIDPAFRHVCETVAQGRKEHRAKRDEIFPLSEIFSRDACLVFPVFPARCKTPHSDLFTELFGCLVLTSSPADIEEDYRKSFPRFPNSLTFISSSIFICPSIVHQDHWVGSELAGIHHYYSFSAEERSSSSAMRVVGR